MDIPIEIIVHDDASSDGSVAWIRRHYPNVELLAAEENAGFCVANNRMVAQARGEYILLLNNDAALFQDAVQALCAEAARAGNHGIHSLPQYDWASGALVDRGCLLDPFYNPVPNLDAARSDVAYAIGACLFMPRSLWNELGGFPEWMGSIGEDMYLCCLARLRGSRVTVLPDSGYRHRQGMSFGGNRVDAGKLQTTYRRRFLSERNKTAVMLVCTPTSLVWPLLIAHLLALCAEGIVLALVKRDFAAFTKIYLPVLRNLPAGFGALLSRRRREQRRRLVSLRRYFDCFTPAWRKIGMLRRYGVPDIQ